MKTNRQGLMAAASFLPLPLAAAPVHSETVDEMAARFALRPTVIDISLSPSGNRIAYAGAGPKGSEMLNVVDLAGDAAERTILRVNEQNSDVEGCSWATDERLVCSVSYTVNDTGVLLGFSRLFAIGIDGKEPVVLSPRDSGRALGRRQNGGSILALDTPGGPGRVLMSKVFVPDMTTGTNLGKSTEGLGVEWVDVTNGKRGREETPDAEAVRYIADENGQVRIKGRRPSVKG